MSITGWENIRGWFESNDANLYDMAVKKFPDDSKFVEVGSWCGRSSLAMVDAIIANKKDIDFFCVDSFAETNYSPKEILNIFLDNTKAYKEYIHTINTSSNRASKLFFDNELDFIYIDSDHTYYSVTEDLNLWNIKVKNGGIIAGHDWGIPEVRSAVKDFCLKNSYEINKTFIHPDEPTNHEVIERNLSDSWYFEK